MPSQTQSHITPEEYLALERQAQAKSEYLNGEIFAMSGASRLSQSTADYDRGGKFEHYRSLDSFQEYLLVTQDRCHIVHYIRQPDNTWVLSETTILKDRLHLPSLSVDLLVSEAYAKVRFDEE